MTTTVKYPDHGDESTWVELTGEETRCLIGLKNYHQVIDGKSVEEAAELAWIDLQHEHPRLKNYTWFK